MENSTKAGELTFYRGKDILLRLYPPRNLFVNRESDLLQASCLYGAWFSINKSIGKPVLSKSPWIKRKSRLGRLIFTIKSKWVYQGA